MTVGTRGSDLVLFDQLCAGAADGGGAVLLVSGPVGTGKTTHLQAMAVRARQRGTPCFLTSASADERSRPFGVFDRLSEAMSAAGIRDPIPGPGRDGHRDWFAIMDRLCAAVHEFAGGRPAVVGIDDIHFADEPSQRCLTSLIRRIDGSGVVLVLTESSSYERDMADLRAGMLPLPFCYRVRLGQLTPAEIAERLAERFGHPPEAALVSFCAETTGGHPLLLDALIEDRATAPGPDADEPGVNFRQAVLRILHRCAPETAAVARSMAVLGDYATPALIAEFGGVDLTMVRERLRELNEIGLLGSEGFGHRHIRSMVLASIPLPNLPDLRSRAAELLHASGAPAVAVAENLIAAHDGGKADWRVTILREAARQAMAAGDVDLAVNSLRWAVASSSGAAQRAQAGALAAEAQWHADPSRAARHLVELSQAARAGQLAGPDTLIVVNQLLWWGGFAEADELMRLAHPEAGDSCLAQLWTFFWEARLGRDNGADRGRPAASPLAESGPLAAATYLTSAATLTCDATMPDRPDQMLLGLRAGAPFTPALYALVRLVQTGRSDEAIAWCDRLLKEDWIAQVAMRRVMIRTIQAVTALRSGASCTALRGIREVLDAVPPAAWGVVAGLPLSVAVRAATDVGDAQSARRYLAEPVPAAMFDTPFVLPYLQAYGQYHLAMGHRQSALANFESCTDLMAKWGAVAPAAAAEDRAEQPDPADADVLTRAEQRVAELAAAGNTNRQIAENLFITVSTVEQHLTKIYRKLNVRSRSGLRRARH